MKVLAKIDGSTGKEVTEDCKSLKAGDGAVVSLEIFRLAALETFADDPALGRFVLEDNNRSAYATGVVQSIKAEDSSV